MMCRRWQINIAWLIFVLVCSVYLLTFRGLFSSVDELSLFSVTESLVQTRSVETPQLAFTSYHNVVGRIEPLYSLLAAPLYWLAVRVEWLGNIQTAMILNILITAATVVALYVLLLACGHPPQRASLVALVYGLATVAWPYSRTFFREPLLALLLTVATLGFLRWRQTVRARFALLTLCCLVCVPFVKVTAALAWPAFALALLLEPGVSRRVRTRRLGFVVGLAGLGAAALVLAYTMRRNSSILAILSILANWLDLSLVLPRLYGLVLGASRGLFLFSPVLLLALPGGLWLWQRRRTEAVLVFALPLAYLFGYSAYGSWHGGLVWGSRFLAPVIPLLFLPVAELFRLNACFWRAIGGVLILSSMAIQLVAASSDVSFVVGASAWDNLVDYARSPLVQQLVRWRPAHFDMIWWHGPLVPHLERARVNVEIALLPLLGLIGSASLLALCLRTGSKRLGIMLASSLLLGIVLVAGIVVLLWQAPTALAGYPGIDPAELRQVAAIVNQDSREPHVVVTVSNDVHLGVLMNYLKGEFVHHWFSPAQVTGFDALVPAPLDGAASLRLIIDRVHMPPECSGQDAVLWLNARLHRHYVDWVGGGYQIYSYLYPPADTMLEHVDYRWQPGMTMLAYGMVTNSSPLRVVDPGQPVWLEFHYQALQPVGADYDIFVQFLSPTGVYVNGTDGPPQFGAAMTSWWRPGEPIVDRRAFFVPEDAAPGEYRVIAGFYAGGERLPVFDRHGQELGTHIELGTIQVADASAGKGRR